MTDNAELLPCPLACPFCGGEGEMSYYATPSTPEPAGYFVECVSCAAAGPSLQIEGEMPDRVEYTKARAVAAWNTRMPYGGPYAAPVPASPPVVEEGEVEQAAWAWMDTKFATPEDYDYSADEMVDAFIAGHSAALSRPRVSREEIARQAFVEGINTGWQCGKAGEPMDADYAQKAFEASDAVVALIGGGE